MIFKELLSGIRGGNVLDVGCGRGQFIEILLQSIGSFDSITGIDVDQNCLFEASTKFPGETFRFLPASSQSLPFDGNSFDLVSISQALHHVEDDRQTIAEMMRVLKPGGCMLINEMIRDGLTEPQQSHTLYHHLRVEIDQLIGVSHKKTYYRSELVDLIESIGLEDLVLHEFQPEEPVPADPAHVTGFIEKMNGWLEEIEEHPKRPDFEKRIQILQERFRKSGISRPTQIIALGTKPLLIHQ